MAKKQQVRVTHNLTKRLIDDLPIPTAEEDRKRYYDDTIRGFGITVYATGKKVFFIEYGPRGHLRRMKLAQYGQITLQQARDLAKEKMADYVRGDDPLSAQQARRAELTFEEWVKDYVERVSSRKKHTREDIRYLGEAKKRWKGRSLSSITIEDVERLFLDKEKEVSKVTANRCLASVRACLQDAWRKDKIAQNPAMKIKAFPPNPPRERVLSDEEFLRVLKAIDEIESVHARAGLMLLVQTGARLSEVLHAKWEDMDLENRIWRIPSTKAGRPQKLPLPDETVAMLKHLLHFGCYVVAGAEEDKPRWDLKKAWAEVLKNAEVQGVHIHDLRRTFGLHIARKAGLHIASKLLRHSDIRVTEKHYAPLGFEELRKALDGREAEVVDLRKKQEEKEKKKAK